MDDALKALRARIDGIDDAILQLVSERAGIAQQVGRAKKGEKIYRPEREAQIVRRLRETNPGPLSGDTVERLIREIMSACRALEETTRVAYLGPAGTFSQQAVHKHFGHEVEALAEADIDACFHAVETGRADFAVVPVENSTEGAICRTLDLIVASPLKICGEVMLPIHQTLMRKHGRPGWHPARLWPCAIARPVPAVAQPPSSRRRTRQRGQQQRRRAPCRRRARCRHAGQRSRRRAVRPRRGRGADRGRSQQHHAFSGAGANRRRAVRARQDLAGDGRAQPAGCRGQAAAAARRCRHFHEQARIAPGALGSNWEYLFFVVCEGHRQDAKLAAALAEIEARAAFLKILGSYPAAS